MVFLTLTRSGYDELLQLIGRTPSVLWVNDGVLSERELKDLRQTGADVTNFTRRINAYEAADVESAVATVREHHPEDRISVEVVPQIG